MDLKLKRSSEKRYSQPIEDIEQLGKHALLPFPAKMQEVLGFPSPWNQKAPTSMGLGQRYIGKMNWGQVNEIMDIG